MPSPSSLATPLRSPEPKPNDAFGLETNTTGTWKTAFGYAGNFGYQKTDAGMKLLGHRYYDPETGRFLSRDPIKDGRNWYGYGAGAIAPLNGVDPTGLLVWKPVFLIAMAIMALVDVAHAPGPDDVGDSDLEDQGEALDRLEDHIEPVLQVTGLYKLKPVKGMLNLMDSAGNAGGTNSSDPTDGPGVCVHQNADGTLYVGQSGNIKGRVSRNGHDHTSGSPNLVAIIPMPGSEKLDRLIVEQQLINDLGGVGPGGILSNIQNPISVEKWGGHGITGPRR